MRFPFFFQRFFSAVNPPRAVHQDRGRRKVHPSDAGDGIERVGCPDEQVGAARSKRNLSDPVRMGDYGVDVGIRGKDPALRLFEETDSLNELTTNQVF